MKNTCAYCGEPTDNEAEKEIKWFILCDECYNSYDNKTGHCSLDCCVEGKCDESC